MRRRRVYGPAAGALSVGALGRARGEQRSPAVLIALQKVLTVLKEPPHDHIAFLT